MMMSRRFGLVLGLALGALAAAGWASPGSAAGRFDGLWSVLVITESGTCDRGYRYSVRVEDGKVIYDGEAGIDLSGTIRADGRLSVSIRRGEQSAKGTGRLSETTGSGEWQGASKTSRCSGRWQAERRGGAQ